MKKFLGKKFIRVLFFLLVFAVTGIVLAYSILSFVGRREWVATRKALEARGEKLSFLDFAPPPLADELNFFSAPVFAELADYELVEKDGATQSEYRVPPAKQQLTSVKTSLATPFRKVKRPPYEKTDIPEVAEYYRAEGRVLENGLSPGEAVLKALEPARPVIEEIEQYAERPGARLPMRYEDGIYAPFPHAAAFISMAQYLSLRAVAQMELDRGAEASKDIMLIYRLSDALSSSPTLISLLVRFSMMATANRTIWEGIVRGAWDDTQLSALEERLRGYDLYPELARSLRAERGSLLSTLETALRKGELARLLAVAQMSEDENPFQKDLGAFVVTNLYPRGWIYGDFAYSSQVVQRWIDGLEKKQGPIRPADFEFLQAEIATWSPAKKLRHQITVVALPSVVNSISRAVAQQTEIDETRVALVIERYRLAHQEIPENLDALVPQYLNAVPLDIMTGKPLAYRRLTPDNFLLWSIGWDGADDSGKPLDRRTEKGDIVWMRLPASAKSR